MTEREYWYGYEIDGFNVPVARPGVYMITNTRLNKSYIGASRDIVARLLSHPFRNMPNAKAIPLFYLMDDTMPPSEADSMVLALAEDSAFITYEIFRNGYNRHWYGSQKAHAKTAKSPRPRWITDGQTTRRVAQSDPLPEGWVRGRSNVIKLRPSVPDEAKPKMRAAKLGKIQINDGTEVRWVHPSQSVPDGWQRGNLVHPAEGRMWINDGESSTYIEAGEKIPRGWKVGRLITSTFGGGWITNGVANRRISPEEAIPEGWRPGQTRHGRNTKDAWNKGRKMTTKQKAEHRVRIGAAMDRQEVKDKISAAARGRFWITNGVVSKRVEIEGVIPDGWHKGRAR